MNTYEKNDFSIKWFKKKWRFKKKKKNEKKILLINYYKFDYF